MKWISIENERPKERQVILVWGTFIEIGEEFSLPEYDPYKDDVYLVDYRSKGTNRDFRVMGKKDYLIDCRPIEGYVAYVSYWTPVPNWPEDWAKKHFIDYKEQE